MFNQAQGMFNPDKYELLLDSGLSANESIRRLITTKFDEAGIDTVRFTDLRGNITRRMLIPVDGGYLFNNLYELFYGLCQAKQISSKDMHHELLSVALKIAELDGGSYTMTDRISKVSQKPEDWTGLVFPALFQYQDETLSSFEKFAATVPDVIRGSKPIASVPIMGDNLVVVKSMYHPTPLIIISKADMYTWISIQFIRSGAATAPTIAYINTAKMLYMKILKDAFRGPCEIVAIPQVGHNLRSMLCASPMSGRVFLNTSEGGLLTEYHLKRDYSAIIRSAYERKKSQGYSGSSGDFIDDDRKVVSIALKEQVLNKTQEKIQDTIQTVIKTANMSVIRVHGELSFPARLFGEDSLVIESTACGFNFIDGIPLLTDSFYFLAFGAPREFERYQEQFEDDMRSGGIVSVLWIYHPDLEKFIQNNAGLGSLCLMMPK